LVIENIYELCRAVGTRQVFTMQLQQKKMALWNVPLEK